MRARSSTSKRPEPLHSWLDLAAGDLLVAKRIVGDEELPPWAAAFHAQQAAEKALKGVLAAAEIAFERIHDLEALAARLPTPARDVFDLDDLARLTPWAVQGRYGIEDVCFTRADVERLVEAAARVVASSRDVIRRF